MKISKYLSVFQKTLVGLIPKVLYNKLRIIFKKFLYLHYYGGNLNCPCCGGRYKSFLSYGRNPKSNIRCPYDDSLERHRFLWIYLINKTNFFQDKNRVLHFGPEDCFQTHFKKMTNLDYISADLYSPKAMIKMDITNISYKANYFDFIICLHVLEHVLDDYKAIKELFRVLKTGGMVFVQCPINYNLKKTFEDRTIRSPEEREKIFGQSDHVRIYGTDFKERLESVGFRVKVVKCGNFLLAKTIKKYVLNNNDMLYICSK